MNSKWSSLDFPLLGADVQNCKKETGEKKGGGSYSYTMIHQNSENLIWQTKYSMRRGKAKQRQANVGFLRSTPTSGDLNILYSGMSDDIFYFLSDTQNKHNIFCV